MLEDAEIIKGYFQFTSAPFYIIHSVTVASFVACPDLKFFGAILGHVTLAFRIAWSVVRLVVQ